MERDLLERETVAIGVGAGVGGSVGGEPAPPGKIDLHSQNSQGPRPIHWASRNGHVAVVDIFLEAGVPVDATDHKVFH